MNRRAKKGSWQAHGVAPLAMIAGLLLGVGAAYAQDPEKASESPDASEGPDMPDVVQESLVAPTTTETSDFHAQQIIDSHVAPVPMKRARVQIENGTIIPRDAKTATLTFDVSYHGCFRGDLSHDATWLFFKVRAEGSSDWQHVRLSADKVMNPTGYGCAQVNVPIDLMVPDGADGFTGLFIRSADHCPGTTLDAHGVTALWDFTANTGITQDTKVEMRAFAFRMIYVPKGPFSLGSGGREMYGFYRYTDDKQDTMPFQVTSPGAIPTGKSEGRLWSRGSEPEDGGEIPATFPNGYSAFYCMASPLDGAPYAAYLNTLTAEDANKRFFEDKVIDRSGKAPNYLYFGSYRMKSNGIWGLSYLDGALFSAWAGLRPMTELEYEKALRGFREPTPDEAGYSFWGMNFGGGIYNGQPRMRVVAIHDPVGRGFKGTHGLGTLALPADWPPETAEGIATRGGWGAADKAGFQDIFRTSDRHLSDVDPERRTGFGWRCVRSAPIEAEWNTTRGETAEAAATREP